MCGVCAGAGKVASKPALGGKPCPACRMTKWLPSLRVEGVVYDRVMNQTLRGTDVEAPTAGSAGLPFRLDEVTVA